VWMFNNRPAKPRSKLASIHSISSSLPSDVPFAIPKTTIRSDQQRFDTAARIAEPSTKH